MGYGHIESRHAEAIEKFYEQHLNPYLNYLNYHRPCGVPEVVTNGKGKQRRVYRWYTTPWEMLRQLPDLARRLRAGTTQADLEKLAGAESDAAAALREHLNHQLASRSTAAPPLQLDALVRFLVGHGLW
jgi:hypothetical protein